MILLSLPRFINLSINYVCSSVTICEQEFTHLFPCSLPASAHFSLLTSKSGGQYPSCAGLRFLTNACFCSSLSTGRGYTLLLLYMLNSFIDVLTFISTCYSNLSPFCNGSLVKFCFSMTFMAYFSDLFGSVA